MILFCRLKARLFGPKNQYFWNKSGKAQPIRSPDQIRYTGTCQGVTTFREFWARSVHFRQNGGSCKWATGPGPERWIHLPGLVNG